LKLAGRGRLSITLGDTKHSKYHHKDLQLTINTHYVFQGGPLGIQDQYVPLLSVEDSAKNLYVALTELESTLKSGALHTNAWLAKKASNFYRPDVAIAQAVSPDSWFPGVVAGGEWGSELVRSEYKGTALSAVAAGVFSLWRALRNVPSGLPSARFTHDQYVQAIRPGARQQTFYPGGRNSRNLGSRRYDDFDPATGTAFEGNTTPWSQMTREQLQRKLEQVASDLLLLRDRNSGVRRVVWFGTEELPTTGLGGQLRQALQEAGIPYWVVLP